MLDETAAAEPRREPHGKACRTCREILPIEAFGRNRRTRDRLMLHCRACVNPAARERMRAKAAARAATPPAAAQPPAAKERPTGRLCTQHSGAIAELAATQWLLRQGFEVFRNVSAAGPADLVAWRLGEAPHLYDVKTMSRQKSPKRGEYWLPARPTAEQTRLGVRLIHYRPDTGALTIDE